MALVITQGEAQHKGGTFQSFERFSGSTATAERIIDNDTDVSYIGMGTATGDNVNNLYALLATSTASGVEGDAVEGMLKYLIATATGEAGIRVAMPTQGRLPLAAMILIDAAATGDLDVTMASATGKWVFQGDGDFLAFRFFNGAWNFFDGAGATMATAT